MAQISYGTITITDLTDITEINIYYAISDQSEGITIDSQRLVPNPDATGEEDAYIAVSIWQTECPTTTAELPYLWQYEEYICGTTSNPDTTIIPPRIIGIFSQSGTDGRDGLDGTGVLSTRTIYFLSEDGSTPAPPEIVCNITEDTTVISGKKYYQLINEVYLEVAEPTGNPHINGYYEILIGVADNNVSNQWTEVVPTYVLGGQYYQCIETIFSNNAIPTYGTIIQNYELTHSQQEIATLVEKGNHIINMTGRGAMVASGINNIIPNPDDPDSYGYNSLTAQDAFFIRYNQFALSKMSNEGISFYSKPTIVNGVETQGAELLNLNNTAGISMYAPTDTGVRGNQLLQLGPSNLIFYNPTIANNKGMELNGTDLIFYNPSNGMEAVKLNDGGLSFITYENNVNKTIATYGSNGIVLGDENGYHIEINDSQVGFYKGNSNDNDPVAYINADQLYITKTVVLDEMLVGSRVNVETQDNEGEWAWRYDASDRSIYLKWIGRIE